MRERFLTGYNDFVLPFVCGMLFVLAYCLIGMIRIIMQLPGEDRKRFFISLVTPKTLVKNIPGPLLPIAHHWLILHGRYTCTARNPKCDACGLKPWCNYFLHPET